MASDPRLGRRLRGLIRNIAFLCGLLAAASVCHGAEMSFRGTFSTDDQVQLFNFGITSTKTVEIRTYGYGGGTQLDGTVVTEGGFDPWFTIFDSTGTYVADNDDSMGMLDSVTGAARDSFLSISLTAGDYVVALYQYDNHPYGNQKNGNISDGFLREGNTDFTGDSFSNPGKMFLQNENGNIYQRTGDWALDISNVDSVSIVPEPSGWVLLASLATACPVFWVARHRRRIKK